MTDVLRAFTVHRPWGTLIALGAKTIETRPRATRHRGMVAIHQGQGEAPVRNRARVGPYQYARGDGKRTVPNSVWEPLPDRLYEEGVAGFTPVLRGAIVATASLVDCVPIIGNQETDTPPSFVAEYTDEGGNLPHHRGGLWLIGVNERTHGTPTRIEDQRPYGDYRPGRWAWLLHDITPLAEPVPAKGSQATPWQVPDDVAVKVREQVPT